jgi:hypothetical protein
MTIHLVNLSNPMMMKGPFRELIPVNARVSVKIPEGFKVNNVLLLSNGQKPEFEYSGSGIKINIKEITDHEIIGIDLA